MNYADYMMGVQEREWMRRQLMREHKKQMVELVVVPAATLAAIAFAVLVMVVLGGCATWDRLVGDAGRWMTDPSTPDTASTRRPEDSGAGEYAEGNNFQQPTTNIQLPTGSGENAGDTELCGTFPGTRPSMALDSKGQPHFVVDRGEGNVLMMYDRIDGKWTERVFVQGKRGGDYDAGRIFLPHLEIDSQDRAWVSAKFGVKTWGKLGGQGVWMVRNVATAPELVWFRLSKMKGDRGNANVCVEGDGAVLLATAGRFEVMDADARVTGSGMLNLGSSGEKVRGAVAGGVRHLVMNGWAECQGMYRNSAMQKPVVWNDYATYPETGIDMCHPGLGTDAMDPARAYVGTVLKRGIAVNVWDGKRMLFAPTNLLMVCAGGRMGVERFGPQFAPRKGGPSTGSGQGGTWVTYCRGKRVKMRGIAQDGSLGMEIDVAEGTSPTIAVGRDGAVHCVWQNGGMRYLKAEWGMRSAE